ncbi:mucolipin-3-like [Erythrolamprus reginae]|uniref:mucolipin-3-like n=1 Tax=Erythrolamprus reginae TaxID=121349 RepID=UPI00396C3A48
MRISAQLVIILFDNKAHSGRIKISLDNDIAIKECKDWHVSGSIQKNTHYMMIFDGFVILTCLASLILCTRSVIKGICLQREFVTFFQHHYKKEVSFSDLVEFVNGWYIMIIVSDLLTIVCSTLKMEIQAKSLTSYDVCSILLGTSTMLVWLGVIRYLSFFKKYNVRIFWNTHALAAYFDSPCSCAAMIYLGYCFCGWIVLGPYHAKHYQREGFPETELHSFIAQCKDLPNSGRYRLEEESPINIFCCCKRS